MAKRIAERSRRISIFDLKKWGFLKSKELISREIPLGWSDGGHVGLTVNFANTDRAIEPMSVDFRYHFRDGIFPDQLVEVRDSAQLVSTPCHYGKRRYWFRCKPCGARVGILYMLYMRGHYFACRQCCNVVYASQRKGGRWKKFLPIVEIDQYEESIKRYYYRGKPTRKHRQLIKMNDRFELAMLEEIAKHSGFPHKIDS